MFIGMRPSSIGRIFLRKTPKQVRNDLTGVAQFFGGLAKLGLQGGQFLAGRALAIGGCWRLANICAALWPDLDKSFVLQELQRSLGSVLGDSVHGREPSNGRELRSGWVHDAGFNLRLQQVCDLPACIPLIILGGHGPQLSQLP